YFSRVVPPESGEGSGSTSSGISASYTCQSDGSWLQTGTPAGGGGSCTDCAFEFVDRWRKDGADVYDWTCTKSCAGSRSSNYSYDGVTGLSHYIPETQSISRCVYEGGVLTSSDIEGCSTEVDNEWTAYGSDSTCPPT